MLKVQIFKNSMQDMLLIAKSLETTQYVNVKFVNVSCAVKINVKTPLPWKNVRQNVKTFHAHPKLTYT